MRRLCFPLVLQAGLLILGAVAAGAAEQVQLRVGVHQDFTRIVFDWPAPVTYQTHIDGDQLTIHFARPFDAKLDTLTVLAKGYISAIKQTDNGATVVATLHHPAAVSARTVDNRKVAVDLTPVAAKRADASAANAPTATVKPATAPASQSAENVHLTFSTKKGAARVALGWGQKVAFQYSEKDGTARFDFARAGNIDVAKLADALPALAPAVQRQGQTTSLLLSLPKGITLKHYRGGNSVFIEVIGKAETAAPVVPPVALAAPAPTQTVNAPLPPPASVAVHYSVENGVPSLRFDWPVPTTAAVFRRGSALWVVFALPTKLDLTELRQHSDKPDAVDQLSLSDATALRFPVGDGIYPAVRRSDNAWIVDLKQQPVAPDAPINIEARTSGDAREVVMPVHRPGTPVRLTDPDAGDTIVAVPVGDLGRGVDALQSFVDFRALPTAEGIVLRPNDDDLSVTSAADEVEVSRPGGLALSSERDRLLGHAPDGVHRLFDFAAWRDDKAGTFLERRSRLEQAIVAAPSDHRSNPRLDLARFYFANLMGAETLGVLEAIDRDDPTAAAAPSVQALKGAACLLAEERDCAAQQLGAKTLDNELEAGLWRGSLAAENGDWPTAAKNFVAAVSLLPAYPKPLRNRFALQAAEALIDTDQAPTAQPLVDLVLEDAPEKGDRGMALYLSGQIEQAAGRTDQALELWQKTADLGDRPSRAHALYAMTMTKLDQGRIKPDDAIKALDSLRFAWRGDAFESGLLRRLGELKLAAGDYDDGLSALNEIVTNFPDDPATKDVTQEMNKAFADIFLGKHAEDVPPLTALALYDTYHDVAASADQGDAILRKLIDRLVSVDLLDRATALLQDEVQHRLSGVDKARVATQLALLRLLDHDADGAVAALDVDVGTDIPPELARQRQQLRAHAVLEQGRPDDALALLAGDTSRDADRLRADIYWRNRNWTEVAKVFARLVPPPADGKLDQENSGIVLSWAAALTLGGDQDGLAKLRETYGAAMAATPSAPAFRLIADDNNGPTSGDPREIASELAQIGELQSFMSTYRQRIANDSLSAIN